MPLTEKGNKILSSMQEQYGKEKGEEVFYASRNAGKIEGVDGMGTKDVSDPRLESINDEGVELSFGDADDPDKVDSMENPEDETKDAPSMYSRGNRRTTVLKDKGVGKIPSYLTSDSGRILRNMNKMNRSFWRNGGRNRGR